MKLSTLKEIKEFEKGIIMKPKPQENWKKDYIILNNGCLIRKDRMGQGFISGEKETLKSLEELLSQSQAQAEKLGYEKGTVHFVEDKPTKGRIAEIRQEQENKFYKLLTEELGVRVKDMPAIPPTHNKFPDFMRLAIQIGLSKERQKAQKEILIKKIKKLK